MQRMQKGTEMITLARDLFIHNDKLTEDQCFRLAESFYAKLAKRNK